MPRTRLTRKTKTPPVQPVTTTNVLAGVARPLRPTVLREIKARGVALDAIRVLSPGRVEFDVA